MVDDFARSSPSDHFATPTGVNIPLMEPRSPSVGDRPGQLPERNPPKATLKDKLICVAQLKTVGFYQALIGEFLGTMLLVLVCTSTGLPIAFQTVPALNGALTSGFMIAVLVVGFGRVSGSHINPAVTMSFLVTREIDLIRAACYMTVQSLGAVSGSYLLTMLAPPRAQGNLGMTTISEGVSLPQAYTIEVIVTFVLCFTVHAVCDKKRSDVGGSQALSVGLAVVIGCLFGGPYTGGSMNPARSLGPAAVMGVWDNHWIYWLGPWSGGILAGLVYTYVIQDRPAARTAHESSGVL